MKRLIIILSIFFNGASYAKETPESFFNNFVLLGDQFDPAVAELYEDEAEILGAVVSLDGFKKRFAYEGWQWKKSIKKVMPRAKAENFKSTYSNITVTKLKTTYQIKADRYSVKKCYTDNEYYMIIKPKNDGGFGIVKEYVEIKELPDC